MEKGFISITFCTLLFFLGDTFEYRDGGQFNYPEIHFQRLLSLLCESIWKKNERKGWMGVILFASLPPLSLICVILLSHGDVITYTWG